MDLENIDNILREVGLEEADRRIKEANKQVQNAEQRVVDLTNHLQDKDREIARLKDFERLVQTARPDQIKRVFDENKETWTRKPDSLAVPDQVYIDDPIYRQLVIEKEITPLFHHPIVQRLAHIKQLSFSYLKFPGATHSRLSHSLGASRNAELALTRILQKNVLYTAQGQKPIGLEDKQKLIMKAKVAGLLHDLGHGPFGHGLDQYVAAITGETSPDKFFALHYIETYLVDALKPCGITVAEILAVLDSAQRSELEGFDLLVSNLLDSPLDVDRMDYLVRDAHMTGLSIGSVNIEALIERMMPFEGTIRNANGQTSTQILLTFDPSAIPYITHVLYARDSMYLNCYEHPRKVLAERMLTKAVDDFSRKNPDVTIDDLILLTDEKLLDLLMRYSDPSTPAHHYASALLRDDVPFREVFSIAPKKYGVYLKKKEEERIEAEKREAERKEGEKGDDDLKQQIPPEEEEIPLKPSSQIPNWEKSHLFYMERNIEKPRSWEKKLAEDAELGADSWKVIVTIPVKMVAPKFDDIKILTKTTSGYDYRKLDRLTGYWESVLKHLGIERYSIRVFASSDLPQEKIDKISKSAREIFTVD